MKLTILFPILALAGLNAAHLLYIPVGAKPHQGLSTNSRKAHNTVHHITRPPRPRALTGRSNVEDDDGIETLGLESRCIDTASSGEPYDWNCFCAGEEGEQAATVRQALRRGGGTWDDDEGEWEGVYELVYGEIKDWCKTVLGLEGDATTTTTTTTAGTPTTTARNRRHRHRG